MITDSGIYALMNLQYYDIGVNMKDKYTEGDIPNLRMKLLNDMVFNEYNTAHAGVSKIKEV